MLYELILINEIEQRAKIIFLSVLLKTNKKNVLVSCWPSGKYVNLLYMYSILGSPINNTRISLITASIRRGMEVISLWHC